MISRKCKRGEDNILVPVEGREIGKEREFRDGSEVYNEAEKEFWLSFTYFEKGSF